MRQIATGRSPEDNRARHHDAVIIGAGQGEKPLVMVTEFGTVVELMRIVDVKDEAEPVCFRVCLRIREWIDERYYRDIVMMAEFQAFYTTSSSRQGPYGRTNCGEKPSNG